LFTNSISPLLSAAFAVVFLLFNTASLFASEIIVVKGSDLKPYNDALEGFKSTCRCTVTELNLAEEGKKNIQERIIQINPDGVLALGIDALNSVWNIDTLPVFYTMVSRLESRTGKNKNNLSGVNMDILPETYLRNMASLFPDSKKIGLIYSKRFTGQFVKEALALCRPLGFEVITREVTHPNEVSGTIESLRGKIDVFWMLPDPTVVTPETFDSILLFSFQNKVPVFSFSSKYVKMGALASLSADPAGMGSQTGALIANKSGNGIAVQMHPKKVLLYVNRKIAEKFGIQLKNEIIRNAAEVY
jgi:putative ABC transport system substrate-binding protein